MAQEVSNAKTPALEERVQAQSDPALEILRPAGTWRFRVGRYRKQKDQNGGI